MSEYRTSACSLKGGCHIHNMASPATVRRRRRKSQTLHQELHDVWKKQKKNKDRSKWSDCWVILSYKCKRFLQNHKDTRPQTLTGVLRRWLSCRSSSLHCDSRAWLDWHSCSIACSSVCSSSHCTNTLYLALSAHNAFEKWSLKNLPEIDLLLLFCAYYFRNVSAFLCWVPTSLPLSL